MQLITGSCGGERGINMAVILREIIKQVQHLEMKLVAGETGLDHEVSWMQIMLKRNASSATAELLFHF